MALTVGGTLAATTVANAAAINAAAFAGDAIRTAVAGESEARIVKVHGGHHGHGHWRHGGFYGWGLALPFFALALSAQRPAPPPAPAAPAWRFDGYRWVCDYVDAYRRPLCR